MGVNRVCSLRKIQARLCVTNFCTSSVCFAPSFVSQPNYPKCTQIVQNGTKYEFRIQGGGSGAFLREIRTRLHGTNFCTSSARFAPSFANNQTVANASKSYEMHQNMSLGSNGLDRVQSLRKIPTRFRCTNFWTSSARFPPSFVTQPNIPKCTQIVWNTPKHQFRDQWGGSNAFIAKNSDATSWHELLH